MKVIKPNVVRDIAKSFCSFWGFNSLNIIVVGWSLSRRKVELSIPTLGYLICARSPQPLACFKCAGKWCFLIDIFLRLDGHACLIILWHMVTAVVVPFIPSKPHHSLQVTFDLALHSLEPGDVLGIVCVCVIKITKKRICDQDLNYCRAVSDLRNHRSVMLLNSQMEMPCNACMKCSSTL